MVLELALHTPALLGARSSDRKPGQVGERSVGRGPGGALASIGTLAFSRDEPGLPGGNDGEGRGREWSISNSPEDSVQHQGLLNRMGFPFYHICPIEKTFIPPFREMNSEL